MSRIRERFNRISETDEPNIPEAIGISDEFFKFQEKLSRVAKVDRPVLLIGERGTGKELAARKLHYLSNRWKGPLVTLNCTTLASTLIESELFGYEAGAFTGAFKKRAGKFEQAHNGTLFLDEVGSIPMEVQEKILRVVEYSTFERVGGMVPVSVDVRIIGATNADLEKLVRQGEFKADLLDRLSFEVILLPPLRKRKEDIMLLATHFASRMAYELEWEELPEFTESASKQLQDYSWPGNVRELKNVVERAVYRSDSHIIDNIIFNPFHEASGNLNDLNSAPDERYEKHPYDSDSTAQDKEISAPDSSQVTNTVERATIPKRIDFKEEVRNFEIKLISEALKDAKYNRRKAADLLGVTYDQLRGLYRKYSRELDL